MTWLVAFLLLALSAPPAVATIAGEPLWRLCRRPIPRECVRSAARQGHPGPLWDSR